MVTLVLLRWFCGHSEVTVVTLSHCGAGLLFLCFYRGAIVSLRCGLWSLWRAVSLRCHRGH